MPYRGGLVTLVLAILLVAPPSGLMNREAAFVDTSGAVRSGQAQAIDFSDGLRPDIADRLPLELGPWTGSVDASWPERLQDTLDFDDLVVHDYTRPGVLSYLQVMVLTARHGNAFHDPQVCFSGTRGGQVETLASTTTSLPGGAQIPVGRMLVTYSAEDGRPAKLVYNVYVIEKHAIAPDRTTWIRIMFPNAAPDHLEETEALVANLLDLSLPHIFQGTAAHRTTMEWIASEFGTVAAGLAALVTMGPVWLEWRSTRVHHRTRPAAGRHPRPEPERPPAPNARLSTAPSVTKRPSPGGPPRRSKR